MRPTIQFSCVGELDRKCAANSTKNSRCSCQTWRVFSAGDDNDRRLERNLLRQMQQKFLGFQVGHESFQENTKSKSESLLVRAWKAQ